jgi:hypothetical protein
MYVPNRGDYIQAFDAATGELLWEYRREFPEGMRGSTHQHHPANTRPGARSARATGESAVSGARLNTRSPCRP